MNKKLLFAMAAAAVMVSCSNDDLVNEAPVRQSNQVPIEFNVQKQNITRAANLETVKHYNFGVWAYKVTPVSGSATSLTDTKVMDHYLVGYGGTNVGYDHSSATTWAATPGTAQNHLSPWFYEGLGTSEYTYSTPAEPHKGFYFVNNYESTKPMAWVDYKSVNANQYLRYWDLAYTNTNFYAYAPYNAAVTFDYKSDKTAEMTFPAGTIRDGYDEPRNHAYDAYDRSLGEFMYAGVQATNSSLADVTVPFKHMGAQLFIRFYEDIPGYKVEIIDLAEDKATAPTTDDMKGIQATPAIQEVAPTKYADQDECDTYNATLPDKVAAGDLQSAAVYYSNEEVDAHNLTLTDAWAYGDVKTPTQFYTADDVTAGTCTAEQVGNVKADAVYYTDAEVNAHNYALSGAWKYYDSTADPVVGEVKTAAVYYNDATAKAYNSELPGAKKVGDIKSAGSYDKGSYYTSQGATVTYTTAAAPTYAASWTPLAAEATPGATTTQTPLMFLIPEAGKTTAADAPANLTAYYSHNVIQEKVSDGTQKYSYSPTIYYPVAQPKDGVTATTGTGLTFHVSYRVIAEDNQEVITVHNATVHVPVIGKVETGTTDSPIVDEGTDYFITCWQPNVKYTYTFKFTRNSNGTTDPTKDIDPTDPSVSDVVSLFPIVFDEANIEDWNTNYSEYVVSEGNTYVTTVPATSDPEP